MSVRPVVRVSPRGWRMADCGLRTGQWWPAVPVAASRAADYLALTKPRLSLLVLAATLAGLLLGSAGRFDELLAFHTLLGTALVAGGASALNQYLERGPDGRMCRTAGRPLPSRRLSPDEALYFGVALSAGGTLYLLAGTGALPAALAAATVILYLAVYTPLKRVTPLCLLAGAVPGAIPPLIGFAAARGALTYEAFLPALIVFSWQYPHFLAISWLYRDDYARGGFAILAVSDRDGRATGRQVISRTLALLFVSLIPAAAGLAGVRYVVTALVLGGVFLGFAIEMGLRRDRGAARRLFLASLVYLPFVLAVMILDMNPAVAG